VSWQGAGGGLMSDALVGRFHWRRVVGERAEDLSDWMVTVGCRDSAVAVAGLLGGELHAVSGGWDVLTSAAALRIIVVGTNHESVTFRLLAGDGLGVFAFRADPWRLADVMGDAVGLLSGSRGLMCELRIEVVQFTTRTGLLTLVSLPVLRVL
jgi:hypothetical protein